MPAQTLSFAGNAIADFLRHDAPDAIRVAAKDFVRGLNIVGSGGAGQWAEVPWIAILDPIVTETATQGYYVVYLFSADCKRVYLSLNQGATSVQYEFKSRADDILRDRANIIRARLADFSDLNPSAIDLQATTRLAKAYEAGHALGRGYDLADLPSEENLIEDLTSAVAAYRALTFRGGIAVEPEPETQDTNAATTVLEKRRMVFHEKIERQSGVSKKVKRHHGAVCQACNLNMSDRYGSIGENFIEAHHLTPLGDLKEGEAREYDIANDFAVLCPNCHRMIHRYPNTKSPTPSDLEGFRTLIKSKKF